jgi:hypothetical protein
MKIIEKTFFRHRSEEDLFLTINLDMSLNKPSDHNKYRSSQNSYLYISLFAIVNYNHSKYSRIGLQIVILLSKLIF